MPTSPLSGDRSRRARRPGDLTGKAYSRLHEEQKAMRDVETSDPEQIRRAAFREGVSAGYDRGWDLGFDAGFQAALQQFREAGLDVESIISLTDDEDAD
jgi:hypothetical protein